MVLGLAGYAVAPAELTSEGRAVVAWDAFASGWLLLLWPIMLTADAGLTRVAGGHGVVWLRAAGPVQQPGGGGATAEHRHDAHAAGRHAGTARGPGRGRRGGGLAAVAPVFALRYAHLYYDKPPAPGGLTIPDGSPPPRYLDFAYFAFVIGMTAQTADVSIYDPTIRATVLVHGLLVFAFNTAVVALSISGLMGVL
ncbi:DUF1345 domain-containing protein [Hymenobacter segetis]|uniref:DUF1345 domain-containing protein n=1 Tax=Hymenobacter segetis TaxID=2025509 RepID=A0ABU9LZ30_9BACT